MTDLEKLNGLLKWLELSEEKAMKHCPVRDMEIWDERQTLQYGRALAFSETRVLLKKVLKENVAP